jgi:hypothetical protein
MVFLSFAFESYGDATNAFAALICTDWRRQEQASIEGDFIAQITWATKESVAVVIPLYAVGMTRGASIR